MEKEEEAEEATEQFRDKKIEWNNLVQVDKFITWMEWLNEEERIMRKTKEWNCKFKSTKLLGQEILCLDYKILKQYTMVQVYQQCFSTSISLSFKIFHQPISPW